MNAGSMAEIWVYLSAQPLLWLTLTLAAYLLAVAAHRKAGGHPAANPVLISVGILVVLLQVTDTPYQRYFDGAQFVHFLLGPATVALAIPLHGQLKRLVAILARQAARECYEEEVRQARERRTTAPCA